MISDSATLFQMAGNQVDIVLCSSSRQRLKYEAIRHAMDRIGGAGFDGVVL